MKESFHEPEVIAYYSGLLFATERSAFTIVESWEV